MESIIENLAEDMRLLTMEHCAKVTEIHRIRQPENEFQRGYNEAVQDIAAKIRELGKKREVA